MAEAVRWGKRGDFALGDDDLAAINGPDTKISAFFNHRDPEWVERLSTRKLDL